VCCSVLCFDCVGFEMGASSTAALNPLPQRSPQLCPTYTITCYCYPPKNVDTGNRDDCASTISFATTRSIGSTQCSAPVLLTEIPAAGRGNARVGLLGGIGSSNAGGGGMLAFASMTGPGGVDGLGMGMGGCEFQEECSREQLEELMQQLRTGGAGSSSDGGNAAPDVEERRRAAAVTLALHAERDAELRAAIVAAGLLDQVAEMLEGPELRCCWAAAHIAWYVSRSDELRQDLGCDRIVAALVMLLGAADPAVARAAALALNNLALGAGCRWVLRLVGCWCSSWLWWEAVSYLLYADGPDQTRTHTRKRPTNYRQRMADAGAITALIDMVRWVCGAALQPSWAACMYLVPKSSRSLLHLLQSIKPPEHTPEPNRPRQTANRRPNRPQQMASSDAIGQEAASSALMMLASEEANIRALIVAANGVRALVSVLQYGGPTAQESAACALENLSLDAACEAALGEEGGVEGLLGLLRDGTPAAQVRGWVRLWGASSCHARGLYCRGTSVPMSDAALTFAVPHLSCSDHPPCSDESSRPRHTQPGCRDRGSAQPGCQRRPPGSADQGRGGDRSAGGCQGGR